MRTVFIGNTSSVGQRALIWCLACCLNVLLMTSAAAQSGRLEIEYTVKVADIPGQLFHVTTDIRNINQPTLELSLPVWSPGWYVIENYAKNVARFRVTGPDGRELRHALVRKQTWRIDTRDLAHYCRVRLSGDRSFRESGANRAGLRVLHRDAAFPSARRSSIAAERGAVRCAGWLEDRQRP
jgi:hypothetical protein